MTPKISVIIPVYNTAVYLERCLNSVCEQTLRDIEVLCVNDASPDNSLEILEERARLDSRIRVLSFMKNMGVSAARNAAIAVAQGEYLGFVDSDDCVDPDFYEKIYAKAQVENALVVKGAIRRVLEDGSVQVGSQCGDVRQNRLHFCCEFFTAIYQTAFVRKNNITFPLGISHGEDIAFLTKAVCLAPQIEAVENTSYTYCRRPDSADAGSYTAEQLCSLFRAQDEIITFLNSLELDATSYAEIAADCIVRCLASVWRVESRAKKENAVDCAESALRLYRMCKHRDAVKQNIAERGYYPWGFFLEYGNVTLFVDFLTARLSPMQRNFLELRLRMQSRY